MSHISVKPLDSNEQDLIDSLETLPISGANQAIAKTSSTTFANVSFDPLGNAIWGSITGTLSNQTDLQNALDNKVPYTGATANVNLGAYSLTATGITNSSMTAGSVLFAGTAGLMSQDNANFFWDDTNNRLGIGTASPGTTLHIVSTAPSGSSHPNRAGLLISSEGTNVGGRIATQVASSTEIPYFFGLRSRGTLASPTAVQNGDGLVGYSSNPYDGTEYVAGNKSPLIIYNATENWSATNHGSKIRFYTVENATTTQAERMVIDHNGYVGIANTSPSALLTLGTAGTTAGTISLAGGTSGTITLSTASTAGTHTIKLPTTDGSANYLLKTDGAGQWGWTSGTSIYTIGTGLTLTGSTITANISTGRSGGQTAYGGTGAGEALTISSTLHASKGYIYLGTALNSYFDEPNDALYIRGWIDTATDYKLQSYQFAKFDGANTLSLGINGVSYQIDKITQKMTMASTRFQTDMGADIASTTNTTLGLDGNVFNITGTTTIDLIESANWQEGSQIILKLDDGLRLSNNVAPSGSMASIITASGANAVIPADGLVQLVYSKGAWREPMTTYALTAGTASTATTATTATNVSVSDSGADTTTWVMLAGSQTGYQGVLTDGGLTYNANTNALTATTFVGALTGNADTITWANEASDTTCFIGFATAASGSLAPKTNTNMTFNSSTGVATFASTVLTTTDINGGTIDGTSIGASSTSTGAFTTLSASSTLTASTTIELGHASDTTLARVSAGLISVEGKTVLTDLNTSGVGASPTSSSTQTITHNLGRVPKTIRIYGYGTFTSNAAATATTSSMGVYTSSGNTCVYQQYGAAITTTQAGLSSTAFSILLATGGGNYISGVIQNVTSTQFDISWTETGTSTAQVFMWEAQ